VRQESLLTVRGDLGRPCVKVLADMLRLDVGGPHLAEHGDY